MTEKTLDFLENLSLESSSFLKTTFISPYFSIILCLIMGRPSASLDHHLPTGQHDSSQNIGSYPVEIVILLFYLYFRVAKGASEAAKNFINISATLAFRQQMRMASFFYRGLFEIEDIRIPEKVTKKSDLSKSDSFEDAIAGFMTSNDLLSSDILYRGQKYTTDELVVIEVVDISRIAVGIIKSILIRGSSVYFIVKKVFANRVKLNFFVSEINDEDKVIFFSAQNLQDFKPLIKYGTDKQFKFYLHHYLSHDFK